MSDKEVLAQHHERFKALLKGTVENLMQHGFTDADDWRIKFYHSQEAFARGYPDSREREEMLDDLESNLKALRIAMKRVLRGMPDLNSFRDRLP
jgi:hypothetical protein